MTNEHKDLIKYLHDGIIEGEDVSFLADTLKSLTTNPLCHISYFLRAFFNERVRVLFSNVPVYILIIGDEGGKEYVVMDTSLTSANACLSVLKRNVERQLYDEKSSELDAYFDNEYPDMSEFNAVTRMRMEKEYFQKLWTRNRSQGMSLFGVMFRNFRETGIPGDILPIARIIENDYDTYTLWHKIYAEIRASMPDSDYQQRLHRYGDFLKFILDKIRNGDQKHDATEILKLAKDDFVTAGYKAFCFLIDNRIEENYIEISELSQPKFKAN